MIIKTEHYHIDSSKLNHCIISGTLRLPSTEDYIKILTPLKLNLETATETMTIDITACEFLNSTGLVYLSTLLLAETPFDSDILIKINPNISWQPLCLSSLPQLSNKITILKEFS